MPTRADLARWILHVARRKVPLTGASDHAVSEAFYLDDPEGNGVEVYCDRPAETWEWTGPDLKITTDPLDVDSILREVPRQPRMRPHRGLRIGHVHLRVGDVARAEAFYRDALGLDVTRRRQAQLSCPRALSPPHRRQCLAQRRRWPARCGSRGIVLALAVRPPMRRLSTWRNRAGASRRGVRHHARGHRRRRSLGHAPRITHGLSSLSAGRGKRAHVHERLGGERLRQFAGGHGAAE
jgi:catechol 2,3-dioxygenase-like lactoylglutathione lyase family enzyme